MQDIPQLGGSSARDLEFWALRDFPPHPNFQLNLNVTDEENKLRYAAVERVDDEGEKHRIPAWFYSTWRFSDRNQSTIPRFGYIFNLVKYVLIGLFLTIEKAIENIPKFFFKNTNFVLTL